MDDHQIVKCKVRKTSTPSATVTATVVVFVLVLLAQCGCRTALNTSGGVGLSSLTNKLTASNDRDWRPDLAILPWAEANGNQITIRNVRSSRYANETDYVLEHHDRTFDLSQIKSADYVVSPFSGASALAHTLISFGLDDGSYIGVSVEVRKERDEDYSAVLGLGRKFELMYVVADEKDLILSRTKYRGFDVYVYPTVATPAQAQALFVDVMDRANKLAVQPEFYNTLTNNCTTNLHRHANRLAGGRINYDWRVLLPSYSAKYAYDHGLLDNSIPFEDLRALALVNDLSNEYFEAADYSTKIRGRQGIIERTAQRNSAEQAPATFR